MGHSVYVGNGLAVEDYADELGGPATGVTAFRRVGVAAFAAVHHKPLHLVGNIGGHLGSDGPGAANRRAVGDQPGRPLPLLRADEVQAAKLVIRPPAAPVLK